MVEAAYVDSPPQFHPAVVRDQYLQHHFQGDAMAWIVLLSVVHCYSPRAFLLGAATIDAPMVIGNDSEREAYRNFVDLDQQPLYG